MGEKMININEQEVSYFEGEYELTLIKTRNQLEDDVLHHAICLEVKQWLRLVNLEATLWTALAALKVFHHTAFADCNHVTSHQVNYMRNGE